MSLKRRRISLILQSKMNYRACFLECFIEYFNLCSYSHFNFHFFPLTAKLLILLSSNDYNCYWSSFTSLDQECIIIVIIILQDSFLYQNLVLCYLINLLRINQVEASRLEMLFQKRELMTNWGKDLSHLKLRCPKKLLYQCENHEYYQK